MSGLQYNPLRQNNNYVARNNPDSRESSVIRTSVPLEKYLNFFDIIETRKANYIGHNLCRNCLLKHVI
jgi:hypothetical protein